MIRLAGLLAVALIAFACGGDDASEALRADPLVGPWQAEPFTLSESVISNVDQACRAWIQDPPEGLRVVDADDLRMVVLDARGAGRIQAHYVGPDGATASCFDMRIDAFGHIQAGGGGTGVPGIEPPTLGRTELRNEGGYGSEESSLQLGRAGDGIVKVVIMRPNEMPITASLTNGWYMAWWPDTFGPDAKADGLDSSGQRVTEIPIP